MDQLELELLLHTLGHPTLSNGFSQDWPRLEVKGIPSANPPTDGDYYDLTIGNTRIVLDWKHLRGEIEAFSTALKPYGFAISYKEVDNGYLVKLVPL